MVFWYLCFEFLVLVLTYLWYELLCTGLNCIRWKVSGGKTWLIVLIIYLLALVNCATLIIVHLEAHYNMSQHGMPLLFNTLYFLDMECQLTSLNSYFSITDYWCFSVVFTCGLMIESNTHSAFNLVYFQYWLSLLLFFWCMPTHNFVFIFPELGAYTYIC